MKLAFGVGAVAAALAVVAMRAAVIWLVTVVSGSEAAWSAAPWLMVGGAVLVALATYAAERFVHRRTMARMRSMGEPWAYRE